MTEQKGTVVSIPQANQEETYREVPGYPGYAAGTNGTIWSCRVRGDYNGTTVGRQWVQRKPTKLWRGQLYLNIRCQGKARIVAVKELVLLAFVGSRPSKCVAVNYPDPDHANCRLDNLRWVTTKEMYRLKRDMGIKTNSGGHHGNSKLIEAQVVEIKRQLTEGLSYREIASEFNVSLTAIRDIAVGRTWSHVRVLD